MVEAQDLNAEDIGRLERNEAGMPRWICNIRVYVRQNIGVFREKLCLRGIICSVQERRLC